MVSKTWYYVDSKIDEALEKVGTAIRPQFEAIGMRLVPKEAIIRRCLIECDKRNLFLTADSDVITGLFLDYSRAAYDYRRLSVRMEPEDKRVIRGLQAQMGKRLRETASAIGLGKRRKYVPGMLILYAAIRLCGESIDDIFTQEKTQ